jgi:hypothetical protein
MQFASMKRMTWAAFPPCSSKRRLQFALELERWVEVDEVDGLVRDSPAPDVEVVAVVEDVQLHAGSLGGQMSRS